MQNTNCKYEASVLRSITCHHPQELTEHTHFSKEAVLIQAHAPSQRVAAAIRSMIGDVEGLLVSQCARINEFEQVHTEDLIVFSSPVRMFGAIVFIFEFQQMPLAIVQVYDMKVQRARTWELHKAVGNVVCLPLADVTCALVWACKGDDVEVIKPTDMQLRTV